MNQLMIVFVLVFSVVDVAVAEDDPQCKNYIKTPEQIFCLHSVGRQPAVTNSAQKETEGPPLFTDEGELYDSVVNATDEVDLDIKP